MAGFAAVLVVCAAVGVLATTWAQKTITCPLCGKDCKLEVIASYGSYIYRWPTKLQLVFWPHTTGRAMYFCPKCHLSLWMGDFQQVPKEKHEAIRKAIAPLKQDQPAKPYYEIPMTYRLRLAQAAYEQLDRDDAFWCHFHRVAGYHFDAAGQKDEAKAHRQKALARAENMLAAGITEPPRKEILFVIGSMQFHTGQNKEARATLTRVKATAIPVAGKMNAEQAKGYGAYLDELAQELLAKIP
jgi:uncharacterized protein (DUF2225 family)